MVVERGRRAQQVEIRAMKQGIVDVAVLGFPVQAIGTGFEGDAEHPTGRVSTVGGQYRRHHLDLFNGVVSRGHDAVSGDAAANWFGGRNAVRLVADAAVARAGDMEPIHAGHARHKVHGHPRVALHDGDGIHLTSRQHGAGGGGRRLKQWRGGRHLDVFDDAADLELRVNRQSVVRTQHYLGSPHGAEAGLLEAQVVDSWSQIERAVHPLFIRYHLIGNAGGGVHNRDFYAWRGCPRCVCDVADDVSRRGLRGHFGGCRHQRPREPC